MAFEHDGLEGIVARLKRAAQLPDECQRELFEIALETQETAKNMTPEDFGDLKNAIEMKGRNVKGQFARIGAVVTNINYEIFVNDNHPVTDPAKIREGKTKVGDYSRQVHEYMGYGNVQGAPMKNGMPFMPSKVSVAIGLAHGVDAGGRFIDRAALKTKEMIEERLGSVVMSKIKALDF